VRNRAGKNAKSAHRNRTDGRPTSMIVQFHQKKDS
jgi:hypothetical protein